MLVIHPDIRVLDISNGLRFSLGNSQNPDNINMDSRAPFCVVTIESSKDEKESTGYS